MNRTDVADTKRRHMKEHKPERRNTCEEHPRRVAFVTNFVPHYRVPFYQQLDAIPELDLLLIHGAAEDEAGRPGVPNDMLPTVASKQIINKRLLIGPFAVRWQSGAFSAVRAFAPDTIVVLGISGTLSSWLLLLWARWHRKHAVMWTCGWESQTRGTFAYTCKRMLMRIYYRLPHHILVYSSTAKAYMHELGVPDDRCLICYNGLDISEDPPQTQKINGLAAQLRSQGKDETQPAFLYVGGLLPEKRVDLLLHAFARLRMESPASLWLVGDGPEMEALRTLVKQLQVPDVHFFGRMVDGVDAYFAAADYFVLPGIGGLALNQAMFRGTPCICSEADGTEHDLVLDGKTGFAFTTDDEDSLLGAMRKALTMRQDAAAYREMTAEAKNLILQQNNVAMMTQTFRKVLLSEHT